MASRASRTDSEHSGVDFAGLGLRVCEPGSIGLQGFRFKGELMFSGLEL